MRLLGSAVLLAALLGLTACAPPFPEPPDTIGADYPGAIPVSVAWPSDWLEGVPGESHAAGWPIVGLQLEHVNGRWVWRVRNPDPGRDIFGESITDPDRAREALIDASTLTLVDERHVVLTEAELAGVEMGAYEAAQLSGEVYPSPRLIGLTQKSEDGRTVWEITTYDTETGVVSVTTAG